MLVLFEAVCSSFYLHIQIIMLSNYNPINEAFTIKTIQFFLISLTASPSKCQQLRSQCTTPEAINSGSFP